MRRILGEPLVHFLALGGLLFALHAGRRPADGADAAESVRVTAGDVAWLRETWSRQRHREPTQDELRALVAEFVREEVLAREARALRLDEKDTVVRRRLAQKLEGLLADGMGPEDPSDEDLRRFHAARPDLFLSPARVSFSQVLFRTDSRPDAEADARAAREALARGADPGALGDRSLLDPETRDADEAAVAAQFGPSYARAVLGMRPGEWQGPVASGFGFHVARVDVVTPARVRDLDEVRAQAVAHWRAEAEREARERFVASLLGKYDVVADESVRPLLVAVAAGPAR